MFKIKAKSLATLTIINAVSAGISYALTISLVKYLGPEIFGIYSYSLLVSSILMLVAIYGTDQYAAVIFAQKQSTKAVFSLIHPLRLYLSFIINILLFFFLLLTKQTNIFFFVFALGVMNFSLSYVYELTGRNERYAIISLCEKLSYTLIILFLLGFKLLSIQILFFTLFIISLISLLFQLFDNLEFIQPFNLPSLTELRALFYFNTPIVLVSMSLFVYGGISRIFLENGLGKDALGKYSAGWQLITISTIFQSQVSQVWRPILTKAVCEKNDKMLSDQLKSYLYLSILPNIIGGGAIIIFSKQIVLFLFGADYIDIISSFNYFGLYFIVISMASILDMLWIALRKPVIYMTIQIFFSAGVLLFFYFNYKNMFMVDFAKFTVASHFSLCIILGFSWYLFYSNSKK